jgi:GAF domain-containing protein
MTSQTPPNSDSLQANSGAASANSSQQASPETLVPRLGDYLIEIGMLLPSDLERALQYQQEKAGQGKIVYLGQALIELKLVDRDVLDQVITQQLIQLQTALRETNRQLEQRVRSRTQDLERRLVQIRTAAEITQLAISATSLDDLLQRSTRLIVERLGYYHASIFMVDDTRTQVVIKEAAGESAEALLKKNQQMTIGPQSIIGWVAANNQARVVANVKEDPYYLPDELLPETRSETAIPISMAVSGEAGPEASTPPPTAESSGAADQPGAVDHHRRVIGVLNVEHTTPNAFDPDAVAMLQVIANHIASVAQNFRLLDTTQIKLKEISLLYQTSHDISQCSTISEVYQVAIRTLKEAPYAVAVLLVEENQPRVAALHDPAPEGAPTFSPDLFEVEKLPVTLAELQAYLPLRYPARSHYLVEDLSQAHDMPAAFRNWLSGFTCQTIAFIPIYRGEKLEALFILGGCRGRELDETALEPYTSLAELSNAAVEKLYALRKMEKSLGALQTLNTISQAVSVETDLFALYRVVHREVSQIMGDINFSIAIYDQNTQTIEVPYMWNRKEVIKLAPFPVGEGLTSIILRTRQPLMIVENTEERTRQLGAKLFGAPAKSWLGAPLLVGGGAIGAIVVQDLEKEHRFDVDDEQLLITLASQVAAAIHNARLLESTHRQAERERLLYEVTSKIRGSTDMKTILATTATELGRALSVQRAHITLGSGVLQVAAASAPQAQPEQAHMQGSTTPEPAPTSPAGDSAPAVPAVARPRRKSTKGKTGS